MAGGVHRRGAKGASKPRGVKSPRQQQGQGRTAPAKPIQPHQPIQAIGTPQGVQYNAFLRGAARNAGMMRGEPTLRQSPKGVKTGPSRIARKLGRQVMAKGENASVTGGGQFTPRGGRTS